MRDDVSRLKSYYEQMLAVMDPLAIHAACVEGSLYDAAVTCGVGVKEGDTRLMANGAPNPILGCDDERGVPGYRGCFFRKKGKGRGSCLCRWRLYGYRPCRAGVIN